MNVGYLEDLQKQYDDPIAHFKKLQKQMTEEYSTKTKPTYLTINPAKSLDQGVDLIKNYGYAALSAPLSRVKAGRVLQRAPENRGHRLQPQQHHETSRIWAYTLSRIRKTDLWKKKIVYLTRRILLWTTYITLFPIFINTKNQLQSWIHDRICENYGKDTTQMYYYVTNHYFEVSEQDLLQKKGVSREYREDPIIQMGLLSTQTDFLYHMNFSRGSETTCLC